VRLVAVLGSATAPGRWHRAVAEAVERAGRRDELSVELIDLAGQNDREMREQSLAEVDISPTVARLAGSGGVTRGAGLARPPLTMRG